MVQGQTNRRGFLKYFAYRRINWFCRLNFLSSVFHTSNLPNKQKLKLSSVLAGKNSDFEPDTGKIIKFGSKPVILIRLKDKTFRAFTATCTHLACTVQFRSDLGVIWCACHNGKYDLNGRNISGPPPRPLTEYNVIQKGKEIYISKNA